MEEQVLMNFGIYLKHLDDRMMQLDREKNASASDPVKFLARQAAYDEVETARALYKKLVIDPLKK